MNLTVTERDLVFVRLLAALYAGTLAVVGQGPIWGAGDAVLGPVTSEADAALVYLAFILLNLAFFTGGVLWVFGVWWGPLILLLGLAAGLVGGSSGALGGTGDERTYGVVAVIGYLAGLVLVIAYVRLLRQKRAGRVS